MPQSLVCIVDFLLSDRVPKPGLQKNKVLVLFLDLDGEQIGSQFFFHISHCRAFLDPGLVGCSPHQQKSRPNLSIRRGLFDFPNFQFLDPASVSLCRLFESGNEVPLQQERRQPWQDGLPPQGRIRLRIRTLPYRFTTRHRLGYIRSRKYLSSRRYGDSRKAG